MICSCIVTVRRQGADVRLVAVAETKRTRLDVQLLTAADALPFSVDALTDEEGAQVEQLLAADLTRQLAEVAALPARIRRIAEVTGLSAPFARALALEVM